MDILAFDIETIPQQAPLSEAQQEEFIKRRDFQLKRRFPDPSILGFPGYTDEQKEAVRGLTMATNYYLGEIVCIGLHKVCGDTGESASLGLIGTEKEILERFWKNLEGFKGLFVSFNGLAFDVPFIVKRSLHHGIAISSNSFIDLKRFSRYPHFDVKLVIGDFDNYASGTLNLVCDFVGVPSPKDGDVKADGVEDAFKNGDIEKIKEYCIRDVEATYKVYEKLKHYTFNINQK